MLNLNYRRVLSTLKSIRGGSDKTENNFEMQYNTESVLTAPNASTRTARQAHEEFGQEWEITPQKPEKTREKIDVPEITIQPSYEELPEAYIDEPEIQEVREIVEEISNPNENTLLPREIEPKVPETSVVSNIDTNMEAGSDMSLDDEIARLLETDSVIKHDLPTFTNVVPAKATPVKEVSVFDREHRPHNEAIIGRQAEKLGELDKKKVRPRI